MMMTLGKCPEAFYCSFKFNGSGLCYELGNNIHTVGDLCWSQGPLPLSDWPDIEIFHSGLKKYLEKNESVEMDDGTLVKTHVLQRSGVQVAFVTLKMMNNL